MGLTLATLALGGCEAPAILARAVAGADKVKAIYKIPDRPTLVLVDDPANRLGDSTLQGVLAANVAFHLQEDGAVKTLIDQAQVSRLAYRLGKEFARMPIDRIGREVGADQVISVYVHSVTLGDVPGVYTPVGVVDVKVIACDTGQRLFPLGGDTRSQEEAPPGHRLATKLTRESSDNPRYGNPQMLRRHLAQRLGQDTAWLFYDHRLPEAGQLVNEGANR
jgi:hypothetical protein